MLAQFNLDSTYRQSEIENNVHFPNDNGWEYEPGPKEIDIQIWATNPKIYVNAYVSYLQGEIGDSTIIGTLITLAELKELGCTILEDYSRTAGFTCANSDNADWLVNETFWWTRSAVSDDPGYVWRVNILGELGDVIYHIADYGGVRPVITISKEALNNL